MLLTASTGFGLTTNAFGQSFSVCLNQPELTRPCLTDCWDSYWWDGECLKVLNGWGLSRSTDGGRTWTDCGRIDGPLVEDAKVGDWVGGLGEPAIWRPIRSIGSRSRPTGPRTA